MNQLQLPKNPINYILALILSFIGLVWAVDSAITSEKYSMERHNKHPDISILGDVDDTIMKIEREKGCSYIQFRKKRANISISRNHALHPIYLHIFLQKGDRIVKFRDENYILIYRNDEVSRFIIGDYYFDECPEATVLYLLHNGMDSLVPPAYLKK